jgi:hypothetical protein
LGCIEAIVKLPIFHVFQDEARNRPGVEEESQVHIVRQWQDKQGRTFELPLEKSEDQSRRADVSKCQQRTFGSASKARSLGFWVLSLSFGKIKVRSPFSFILAPWMAS